MIKVSEAITKMISFSKGNQHDICHFLKVWGFARTIGEAERLDERTLKVEEPVTLKGKRKVYIVGPGLLNADISGAKGVTVEIARNAALINRSAIPYPKSGIVYTLRGESYLNFLNQKPPEDDNIRNVYVNGENEILDYGGPLTYREAREEAYKQNLEAYRRDAERRRKSHDLRDAGIHEAF